MYTLIYICICINVNAIYMCINICTYIYIFQYIHILYIHRYSYSCFFFCLETRVFFRAVPWQDMISIATFWKDEGQGLRSMVEMASGWVTRFFFLKIE